MTLRGNRSAVVTSSPRAATRPSKHNPRVNEDSPGRQLVARHRDRSGYGMPASGLARHERPATEAS